MSKLGLYNMFLHYVKAERSNFTYALAEPGICGSDIVRNYPLLVKGLAKFGMNLLFQTPLQGSLSAAYLMTHEIDNGDYVVPNGLFAFSGVPKKRKLSEKKAIYSLPYKILTKIYDK